MLATGSPTSIRSCVGSINGGSTIRTSTAALRQKPSFETWQEPSAYAREHTHKPPGVARWSNADGHRTASGAMWTPGLVRFLLALMFNDFGSRSRRDADRQTASPSDLLNIRSRRLLQPRRVDRQPSQPF